MKTLLMLLLTAICGVLALGQAPINPPTPMEVIEQVKGVTSWEQLLTLETAIMSVLIIVGGFFTWLVPGLKNIHSNTYRVLTFAILVVAGFVILGFANVWQGAISYLFASGLYQVMIRPVAPTPRPQS
jgi:magnesium-transporting ATPase (P-type)